MNMVFVETQADFASAESFTSDLGNFFIVEMNNKKTNVVSLLLISENGQNKIHRLLLLRDHLRGLLGLVGCNGTELLKMVCFLLRMI